MILFIVQIMKYTILLTLLTFSLPVIGVTGALDVDITLLGELT